MQLFTLGKGLLAATCLSAMCLSLFASTALAVDNEVKFFNCDNPTGKKLSDVMHKAEPGMIVKVSGNCVDNIQITAPITLDGQGTATFAPADPTITSIWISQADGAEITGFNITAGPDTYGIVVTDKAYATVSNNTITGGSWGIGAFGDSLVNIVGNHISGATSYGINVGESATARIGYKTDGPQNVVIGNVIENNNSGILVLRASAVIVSNQILNNSLNGIVALNEGSARVANNEISGNNLGIVTISNGSIDLSDANSALTMTQEPNYGVNNTLAIYCNSGFMSGTIGPNFLPFSQFLAPCENQTTP